MSSKQDEMRERRRRIRAVKETLRDLNIQLSLLNRQFGARVDLKDADWDCLDLLNRHGPLSPTVMARTAGLHPATMTGILDRLQRGGWITRERVPDAADRRAVIVRPRRERNPELFQLFSGMNAHWGIRLTGPAPVQARTTSTSCGTTRATIPSVEAGPVS